MRRGSYPFSIESRMVWLLAWLLTLVYSASGAGTITNLTEASLQAALKGGGTARFGAGGTIILTNTLLITTNTILDANGNVVTISGGNAVRIFQVATNVTFQLHGVTLADGRVVGTNGTSGGENVRGACILSLGGNLIMNTCTLTNCYLKGGDSTNAAKGGDALGGAIFSLGGYLKATNCEVIGSAASGGGGSAAGNGPAGQALGAAIYSESGTAILENVNLTDNIVEGGIPGRGGPFAGGPGGLAAGGGIYASNSTVIVDASAFTNNTVMGGGIPLGTIAIDGLPSGDGIGGAVFLSSSSTGVIQRAFFTANSANGGSGGKYFASGSGRGGAVFSAGNLKISQSTFANNNSTGGFGAGASPSGSVWLDGSAPGQGGAVCSTGELELTGCALLSNYAIGGGNYGSQSSVGQPAAGQGGGIWSSGTLAATNSTITANDAIGGENWAASGGASLGGPGNGGGLCITGGSATLINLTIASNRADGGTNWVNGLPTGIAQGGALFATNSTVTLRNSILANSANGGDFWGAVTDAGYNLCSDGTAGFSGPGSLNQVDPMLSALSQNGGPTPTMALLAGSPARDAIPSGFPPTDQRGVTRPQGPAADIGAFEADFISAAAAILQQPKPATVRAGTNYAFVVVASGTAPLSYLWRKDGNVLVGVSASTLSLTNVQASDAGTYSVVVTNAFGMANSLGAALVVDSTPLLLTQPASVIVSPGAETNFQVLANGPQLGYQWWHNGLPIPGGTSSTLTISNAVAGSQGGYFAVISNFAGTATSATATLSFDSSALIILVSPKDTTVEAGFTASLTVVASGIPPLVYQWEHDGVAISGATQSSLTLTNAGTKDAGSYTVVVTNGYREVISSAAQLVVTPGAIPVQLTAKGQGSSIIIDFQGEAGRQYRLLASTDLKVWSPVATNAAVLAGPLEFVQPLTTSNVFYRLVTP